MRHIIPISGKDSLATAIVQMTIAPDLPYEFWFNDTGGEIPETYQWLDNVEKYLGIKIVRIGKSLRQIILSHGFLPSHHKRYCTKEGKIMPMVEAIGNDYAYVYYGLRADEMDRTGYNPMGKYNITPVYPLRQMGIGINEVYQILEHKGLLPPVFFWESVYKQVIAENIFFEEWLNKLPKWVFDRIFCWRTRANCYWCFYQRRYEWAGLLEHHPELFADAKLIESIGSGDEREEDFFWIGKDFPLTKIEENFEKYRNQKVREVVNMIYSKQIKTLDEIEMAGTSCGLLCGK